MLPPGKERRRDGDRGPSDAGGSRRAASVSLGERRGSPSAASRRVLRSADAGRGGEKGGGAGRGERAAAGGDGGRAGGRRGGRAGAAGGGAGGDCGAGGAGGGGGPRAGGGGDQGVGLQEDLPEAEGRVGGGGAEGTQGPGGAVQARGQPPEDLFRGREPAEGVRAEEGGARGQRFRGGGLPVGPFFKPIAICGAAVAGIAALLRAVDDESLNFIIEGDGMAKNLGGYVGGEAQLKDPVKGYWKGDYKVQRKESKPRPLTPAKLKADKLQIPVLEAPVDLDFDVPKTAAPKAAAGSGTVFNFNAGGTKKVAPKKKSAPKKKVAPKGTVFSPSFGAPAKKAASKPKPAAKKAAPKPKPAAPKSTKKGTSEWKGILLPGRVEL